jgi:hypothetical protein
MSELTRAYSAAFLSMKSVGILRHQKGAVMVCRLNPASFPNEADDVPLVHR